MGPTVFLDALEKTDNLFSAPGIESRVLQQVAQCCTELRRWMKSKERFTLSIYWCCFCCEHHHNHHLVSFRGCICTDSGGVHFNRPARHRLRQAKHRLKPASHRLRPAGHRLRPARHRPRQARHRLRPARHRLRPARHRLCWARLRLRPARLCVL